MFLLFCLLYLLLLIILAPCIYGWRARHNTSAGWVPCLLYYTRCPALLYTYYILLLPLPLPVLLPVLTTSSGRRKVGALVDAKDQRLESALCARTGRTELVRPAGKPVARA